MPKTDVEFTFEEAVRTMGVTPERLQKLIDEGKIPAYREGIRTLIPRQAILDYFGQVSAVLPRDRKKQAAATEKQS